MDIYERRRLALLDIIKMKFGGSRDAICKATGKHELYVSSILSRAGTRGRKRLNDETAREMEVALGLKQGELVDPVRRPV